MSQSVRHCMCLAAFAAFFLGLAAPHVAGAHEIPASVVVQTWVKPQRQELHVLVRVPLEAMRDVVFPVRGPGYIDIAAADDALHDAAVIWVANEIGLFEDGQALPAWRIDGLRLSLPSDRSFRDFDRALAHIEGPRLAADTELYVTQAVLDIHLVYAIEAADSEFSIYPDFRRLGLDTTTVVRFVPPGGGVRVFEFSGDPGLVQLDPRWYHAFGRFIAFGFEHILDGTDHLLFVLCLIAPLRRFRPLVTVVTSFTVGHSITLVGSAFGLTPSATWFPLLIESLIALSIVYMALENMIGSNWRRRWLIAFGFGLVHGFGFSFALAQTLQFAGTHLLTSLLAFNLGVEAGQLLIVVIAVPMLNWLFRAGLPERAGVIILSAILAHSGWHWMTDRVTALTAFGFGWPVFDAQFFGLAFRWLLLAVIVGVALRIMYSLFVKLMSRDSPGAP